MKFTAFFLACGAVVAVANAFTLPAVARAVIDIRVDLEKPLLQACSKWARARDGRLGPCRIEETNRVANLELIIYNVCADLEMHGDVYDRESPEVVAGAMGHWRTIFDSNVPPGYAGEQTLSESRLYAVYRSVIPDEQSYYELISGIDSYEHYEPRAFMFAHPLRRMAYKNGIVIMKETGEVASDLIVGTSGFYVSYLSDRVRIDRGLSTDHLSVMLRKT